jgi:hypothetical protein
VNPLTQDDDSGLRFQGFLSGTHGKVVVSGWKTLENGRKVEGGSRNTVIISGGGILKFMVGSGWNWENPATEYNHRITASTLLPFSGVFQPDLVCTLSPG